MKTALASALLLALVACTPAQTPPPAVASASPPKETTTAAPAKETAAASEPKDALAALNAEARASYRAEKEHILAHLGPTILSEGGKLVYLHDGRREEAEINPRGYHELKTLDHIPLALEALVGEVDGSLDEARLQGLKRLRTCIEPAVREFESHGYAATTIERQRRIVSASTALIDGAIERRSVSHAAYAQYAKAMGPLLLASVDEAARLELDAIHRAVTGWKKATSPAEWSRLRVVVISVHMARDRLMEMQYFQRLLGESFEGGRIVFAEGLWEEPKALDLNAIHVLDARVGASFFGDPMRMHRDLLSDAAAAYLPTLLPAAGAR
ncbi:hypothetical protein LZC95_08855 [Pendulispora brunnea]|uniref:Lipoprotein n=1 Tax=Pendulispora brunnea TaxID=2905690 RepID=A0ABZ2KE13_9BACT